MRPKSGMAPSLSLLAIVQDWLRCDMCMCAVQVSEVIVFEEDEEAMEEREVEEVNQQV